MENPVAQFLHLIGELRSLKLAYLHIIEARVQANMDFEGAAESIDQFVDAWRDVSPVIVAGGYTGESAAQTLDGKYKGKDVLIGFGRPFVSNPDLPFRIQHNLPFEPHIRDLFYIPLEPKGYTDYELCQEYKLQVDAK